MAIILCYLKKIVNNCVLASFLSIVWLHTTMAYSQTLWDSDYDADRQFNYARHCLDQNDFQTAIDEFKRFIFYYPQDDRIEEASFNIALSLYSQKNYDAAIESLEDIIDANKDLAYTIESYYLLSKCYQKLGQIGPAISSLQTIFDISQDLKEHDKANYHIAWIYLEQANWKTAIVYFDKISDNSFDEYRIPEIKARLAQVRTIPKKSPHVAGLLAIFPGAGYVYMNRYQDALIAFVLNTGLILSAVESFDQQMYALGGLISLIEVGFYGGSIYGAIGSAYKYNRRQNKYFIEDLRDHLKIGMATKQGKPALLFGLRFDF